LNGEPGTPIVIQAAGWPRSGNLLAAERQVAQAVWTGWKSADTSVHLPDPSRASSAAV